MKSKNLLPFMVCFTVIAILLSLLFLVRYYPSPPPETPISTISPTITLTPSPTPTPIPSPTPRIVTPTPSLSYTVKQGDTLQQIADGLGLDINDLIQTNHLSDPNLIFVGQVLSLIPAPTPAPPQPQSNQGKEIIVVLSTQRAYAYENGLLIREFLISSGIKGYETITGSFKIYLKLEVARMRGDGYDIPDVPWTMYFSGNYGLHGAYWHNNFGRPMSHGCVNMRVEDAQWLYQWAPMDTPVIVRSH